MGSLKEMPYKPTVSDMDVFNTTFNQMFGEPLPKKAIKDAPVCKKSLHTEKEKKGGKDE